MNIMRGLLAGLLLLTGAATHLGCKGSGFSSRFGIATISMPSGEMLYLKRQVRGLSFDELAISTNASVCAPANPETDYIFSELGAGSYPIFYSTSKSVLTIYHTMSLREPQQPSSNLKVVAVKLNPSEYLQMTQSFSKSGINRINVTADSACR
jgi:hypothetical protein